ncbi:MAG: DUF3667 domain-containing protein [Cytophagaceae bacterium]
MNNIVAGQPEPCYNCSKDFDGLYCNHCGQKKFDRQDFNIKEFSKEFADDLFDFDSKIFNTLKLLVLKPGKLTIDYISGKQRTYISPVKLYLVIITVNFLVYSFFDNYSPIESSYLLQLGNIDWVNNVLQTKIQKSGITQEAFFHELNLAANNAFSISLYFIIFIFAFVLKLYYFKKGRFYIEHLIFCLYFMSFGFLRDTLCLPLYMINKDIAVFIGISTTLIYFYLSIKPVYGNSGILRVVNSILLYGIFFSLFSIAIVFSIIGALLAM